MEAESGSRYDAVPLQYLGSSSIATTTLQSGFETFNSVDHLPPGRTPIVSPKKARSAI